MGDGSLPALSEVLNELGDRGQTTANDTGGLLRDTPECGHITEIRRVGR